MRGLYLITNDDPIQLLLEKLDAALATVKSQFYSTAVKK